MKEAPQLERPFKSGREQAPHLYSNFSCWGRTRVTGAAGFGADSRVATNGCRVS